VTNGAGQVEFLVKYFGIHHIRVTKSGYSFYEQKVHFTKGAIALGNN